MKANFIVETAVSSNRLSGFGQTSISSSNYKGVSAAGTTIDATSIGGRELNASVDFASGTTVGMGFGSTALRVMSLGFDATGGTNLIGSAITNDGQFSSNRATGAVISQKLGAFTVGAAISANKNSETNKEDVKVGSGSTLSLAYAQGPLAFGVAHQSTKTTANAADSSGLRCMVSGNSTTATITGYANAANQGCASGSVAVAGTAATLAVDRKVTTDFIGASYDLGMAKLFASYGKVKTDDSAQVDAANEGSRKAYAFGAQVPVGAFVPFFQYSSGKVEQVSKGISLNNGAVSAGKVATSRDIKGYTVGTRYNMSKRTSAYFAMGQTKLDLSNAVSGSSDFGSKIKQTTFGLAHSF
jgi:predicted porin